MTARTLLDLLTTSTEWLASRGIENARRETEWLFAHVLQCERLDLYLRFDMPMDADDVDALRAVVARRGKREPLAYILGTQPFFGLDLRVGPEVLVPRPETEELVAAILDTYPAAKTTGWRVLDVGTGSGAIALALAQERPDWQVTGSDVSAAALTVAKANGERLGLSVTWVESDLLANCPGPWDLVVSNPPYIATSERELCDPELQFEPQNALFSDEDGMAHLASLLRALPTALAPGRQAWFEHGFQQADAMQSAAAALGLQATTHQDGAGHDRWTMIEGQSA